MFAPSLPIINLWNCLNIGTSTLWLLDNNSLLYEHIFIAVVDIFFGAPYRHSITLFIRFGKMDRQPIDHKQYIQSNHKIYIF